MYGKAYEAMYEGSMVGAGLGAFAVWNYCIAKNRSGVVELNPKLLAFVLGATPKEIVEAITKLCDKDTGSRSKECEGRRLLREGEYQYRMVNWAKYEGCKSAEDLREYNRRKQAESRARKKALQEGSGPLPGETAAVKAYENGHVNGDFEPVKTDVPHGTIPSPEPSNGVTFTRPT